MKLPDLTQLNIIDHKATITGLNLAATYWSTQDANANMAWHQYFATGNGNGYYKGTAFNVRCVR